MKRFRKAVALVLCLLIFSSTAAAFDTSRDSGLLKLVNKTHSLSETYIPELVELSGLPAEGDGLKLRTEAAEALYSMLSAMAEDGINPCNVISCYRSYAYQLQLVTEKVEKRVANGQNRDTAYDQVTMSTAPAGSSEHQMGLAIDFSASSATSVSFANTAAGAWLKENAWKYGFILRYPADKAAVTGVTYEPYHFRSVDIPHAYYMTQNGLCLEEYLDELAKTTSPDGKHLTIAVDGGSSYEVYYVKAADATVDIPVPADYPYAVSGDNQNGFIVTVTMD